ncbi:MAG: hypothetical protein DRI32_08170 [Chloroflexi bacterium]|nr:MAG: hypothetical protein DRI32_08170 [Chloroflexota bacterium]
MYLRDLHEELEVTVDFNSFRDWFLSNELFYPLEIEYLESNMDDSKKPSVVKINNDLVSSLDNLNIVARG